MSNPADFVIENGVLTKYVGPGGDVVIPEGVKKIGIRAFSEKNTIVSVVIPEGVEFIAASAFRKCASLISVDFPKSLRRIASEVFYGCSSLSSLVFPDGFQGIGGRCFFNCPSLVEVDLPESINGAGISPFDSFDGLKSVPVFSEKTFNIIFESSERDIKIQLLYRLLKDQADYSSAQLKMRAYKKQLALLAISEDNGEALAYLFSRFKKITLEEVDFYLSKSEKSPQTTAFLLDYKSSHFSFKQQENALSKKIEKEIGFREKSLSDWKKIYLFRKYGDGIMITGYKGTEQDVIIPELIGNKRVIAIDIYAFSPYAPRRMTPETEKIRSELRHVTMPSSVVCIGEYAFCGCRSLASITIPDSVKEIADGTFEYCPNLTIHASAGSYAETYAKENNIPFVAE